MLRIVLAAGLAATCLAGNVFAADAAAGKEKATTVCAACHGADGISSNPIWPNLAGQKDAYLAKQLNDFKSGARKDPVMAGMAAALSDADIANIAAYYASLGQ